MYINSPGGVVTSGLGDLRHDPIHQARGFHALHRARGVDGLAPSLRRREPACASRCRTRGFSSTSLPAASRARPRDIERHAEDIIKMKRRLNEIYVKHTGQSLERIERTLDRDYFMTAEEAKDFRHHRQGADHADAPSTAARRRPEFHRAGCCLLPSVAACRSLLFFRRPDGFAHFRAFSDSPDMSKRHTVPTDPLVPSKTPFGYNVGVNYESWEDGRVGYSIPKDLDQIFQNFRLIRTYHDAAVGTANSDHADDRRDPGLRHRLDRRPSIDRARDGDQQRCPRAGRVRFTRGRRGS